MITRHHVALVIFCTLILCGALVPFDPVLILVICLGACTGAIMPDIQMKKPQGIRIRTAAWMITRFSSILCTPVICWLYHALSGRSFHSWDKRLTHSIPGILFLWLVLAVLLLVPASVMDPPALPSRGIPLRCDIRPGAAPSRGHVYAKGDHTLLPVQHNKSFRFDTALRYSRPEDRTVPFLPLLDCGDHPRIPVPW